MRNEIRAVARPGVTRLAVGADSSAIQRRRNPHRSQINLLLPPTRSPDAFATLQSDATGEIRKTLASLARFGLLADRDAEVVGARVSVALAPNMAAARTDAGIVFEAGGMGVEAHADPDASAVRDS